MFFYNINLCKVEKVQTGYGDTSRAISHFARRKPVGIVLLLYKFEKTINHCFRNTIPSRARLGIPAADL